MEKDQKERLKAQLTERFCHSDKQFNRFLEEICYEIDKIGNDSVFTVKVLKSLPYELAMLIVLNLKYEQDDYIGMLNSFYYDDFVKDNKEKDENNISSFEKRLICQKSLDYELFSLNRLLTLGEIECLIEVFIEQEKENLTFSEAVAEKYKGKSKNIKILVKSHKQLCKKENAEINQQILTKMSRFWLCVTLDEIKDHHKQKRDE